MIYCASYSKAQDLTIALDAIYDESAAGLNGIPPDTRPAPLPRGS